MVAKHLIQNGAEINLTDKNSQSALHLACFYGKEEMTSVLVHSGCDTDLQDSQGQKPINVAMEMGNTDIVQLLRKNQTTTAVRHSDVRVDIKGETSPKNPQQQNVDEQSRQGINKTTKDGSKGRGPSQKSKSSRSSRSSGTASPAVDNVDGIEEESLEIKKDSKSKRKFGHSFSRVRKGSGKKRENTQKKKKESKDMSDTATKQCCVVS